MYFSNMWSAMWDCILVKWSCNFEYISLDENHWTSWIVIVVPEEEETEEDSKPSEQFEPAELNGVWLKTFINKKIYGYLMFEF